VRQDHIAKALRRGGYDEIAPSLVMWLTAVAVALSTATLVLVGVAF
jgi:hypothetical protein